MSLISKNNYEAYLLDYVEDNLSPELIAELMLFFENNPDLKEDIEAFEVYELIPNKVELSGKSQLKKVDIIVDSSNYESFLIAEIEGLNSAEISTQLKLFLESSSALKEEFLVYQNTKVIAPTILFEEKKLLKKKEPKIIPLYWWPAVAAAIVFLVWLNVFNDSVNQQYYPLAETDKMMMQENDKDDTLAFYVFDEVKIPIEVNQEVIVKRGKGTKILVQSVMLKDESASFSNVLEKETEEKNNTSEIDDHKIKEEEVLYAESNVRIVYEDAVSAELISAPAKKKVTKLRIVSKAIKHQVKSSLFDKGRDRVLLAINSKPLRFIKSRKKKE